jgi:hypothetical protein
MLVGLSFFILLIWVTIHLGPLFLLHIAPYQMKGATPLLIAVLTLLKPSLQTYCRLND